MQAGGVATLLVLHHLQEYVYHLLSVVLWLKLIIRSQTDNVLICRECDRTQFWRIDNAVAKGVHLEIHPLVHCAAQQETDLILSVEQKPQTDGRVQSLTKSVSGDEDSEIERLKQQNSELLDKLRWYEKLERQGELGKV